MQIAELQPKDTTFVLLSFEGPDLYSLAGGLGVRVSELARTLASLGYETHLFFVGDPDKPERERDTTLPLTWWRIGQEVSRRFPTGVYAGEHQKHAVYTSVTPYLVIEQVVKAAVAQHKHVIIMGEEWHTSETMCVLHERLIEQDLRHAVIMLWNANNIFGFEQINWQRLQEAAHITAVSRYMKLRMWEYGINPLIIPNGVPVRFLDPVRTDLVQPLQQIAKERLLLTKTARFDPSKNWIQAIHAVARLKAIGLRPLLLARGGLEPYGGVVWNETHLLNLRHVRLTLRRPTAEEALYHMRLCADEADVLELDFYVPEALLRAAFKASHAVLANSGHEPFGLVGLETMAVGGVAFTGSTGEDYAQHWHNAIMLDTPDPMEIVGNLLYLQEHPELEQTLRQNGPITARFYLWERVVETLRSKVRHLLLETNWSSGVGA